MASLSYPWDEVISDFFEVERGIPLPVGHEGWEAFDEVMENCISEINETASYGVLSYADRADSMLREQRTKLEANQKWETDWRDERIKELESKVQELWVRVDRAERD